MQDIDEQEHSESADRRHAIGSQIAPDGAGCFQLVPTKILLKILDPDGDPDNPKKLINLLLGPIWIYPENIVKIRP